MMRIGSGCASITMVVMVLPLPMEYAITALSNQFGPDLQDYCTKENLVRIYDRRLYHKRQQEVDDKDAVVSEGWKTVVYETEEERFLYNHIRRRSAQLFHDDIKVAEKNSYSLDRDNITTLIGVAPSGEDTPCQILQDYTLHHSMIIEPYNDDRFAYPDYE